ncbi:hypothetical protein DPMN_126518 [Dreissena polymorpha]|uniref:Uncharacterized protein n=1 Tax=Dreissena polymorpha TaxID=45954 RepID=A0A9D4JUJ3_DREPO|nr:hypothetical protein DPMN_126518 [Dreissena polymorpha]
MIYENLGSQKLVNSARRRTKIPRLGLLHMRYKAVSVPQQPAVKNIWQINRLSFSVPVMKVEALSVKNRSQRRTTRDHKPIP